MRKQAKRIILTEKQKEIVEKMSKQTHKERHFVERATIIILASNGTPNTKISNELKLQRNTVAMWRNRWAEKQPEINHIEINEPKNLLKKIKEVFSDEQRTGKKPIFTSEQVSMIIALSLQSPESQGIPLSNWTYPSLKSKAIDLKIVETISESQVRRFLKKGRDKSSSV